MDKSVVSGSEAVDDMRPLQERFDAKCWELIDAKERIERLTAQRNSLLVLCDEMEEEAGEGSEIYIETVRRILEGDKS